MTRPWRDFFSRRSLLPLRVDAKIGPDRPDKKGAAITINSARRIRRKRRRSLPPAREEPHDFASDEKVVRPGTKYMQPKKTNWNWNFYYFQSFFLLLFRFICFSKMKLSSQKHVLALVPVGHKIWIRLARIVETGFARVDYVRLCFMPFSAFDDFNKSTKIIDVRIKVSVRFLFLVSM